MIYLAVSLSLLWALAFLAWREWIGLKRPTNDYTQRLNVLDARVKELGDEWSTVAIKLGWKASSKKTG